MRSTQLFLFVFFAALLALTSPARADTTKKKKIARKSPSQALQQEGVQEVAIPMAHGALQAEVQADVDQRERANRAHTKVRLGASTWKPARATTGSRIAGATDFGTKGIPALEVAVISPLRGRKLHLEIGLGLLALQRTGSLITNGLTIPQEQNAYATTLRLGVQYSPWLLLEDRLQPYVAAAALPSMLITRATAFDDGVSDFGVPFEIGAGAILRISKPVGIDVGVTEELGKVQESDFKGFGVRAGVRVQI